MHKLK